METISIKMNHSSEEGINNLLAELPFQANEILVSPGYTITKEKLTFYLQPEYAEPIEKSIMFFAEEYGLKII